MISLKNQKKHILTNVSKAVTVLMIITLISKLMGLFREIGIAASFGSGLETDAFYVAFLIPTLIFTSIGLALQNLFMIEFTRVKDQSDDLRTQSQLISKMVNILLIVALVLFTLSFFLTDLVVKIVAPGFTDPAKIDLTVTLTRILLPTVVVIPIYHIKASVMKVYHRFGTVGMIDLIFNISQLVYLFFFADRFGIQGLAYAILIAFVLQWVIVELLMAKMGFRHSFHLGLKDDSIKRIFQLFFPTLISFIVIQLNAIIEKIIASTLPEGSISALNYAMMVRNLVFNILVLSVITVIYPRLLHYKTTGDDKAYNTVAVKTVKFLMMGIIPLITLMMLFPGEIVQVIFERGEFTPQATAITGQVLFYYTIGILFFSLKEFFIRIAYANKDTKLPLFITVIATILNIAFSLILKEFMGTSGIALGLSLSELVSLLLLVILIGQRRYVVFSIEKRDIMKLTMITVIIGLFFGLTKSYLVLPTNRYWMTLAMGGYFLAIVAIFFGLACLFRLDVLKTFQVIRGGQADERQDDTD